MGDLWLDTPPAGARSCPDCGTPFPADAPRGLCPSCLLAAGSDTLAAHLQFLPGEEGLAARDRSGPLQSFGDYELEREVARGGMGVVYQARQRSLNRTVALKMLLAGPLASESFVHRFRAEAEAAARLRHPNIVAIHEVGEHAGLHYFSMDFIEGRTLAELLHHQLLPPDETASLLRTLAEAVHFAHGQGVLHRDLKPSNVLIDAAGQPHITDFGLARQCDRDSDLTASGAILGTPNYMSPEQAAGEGRTVGPAADVYALGAILYEALTGRPPFRGSTPVDTLKQVLESDPVPPRALHPHVPVDLETVCLKCLEKEPQRRYASAAELAADLRRFLRREPVQAHPLNPLQKLARWGRRNPGVAALTALVAALLGVGFAGALAGYARIATANRTAQEKRRQAEATNYSSRHQLALSYVASGMRILDAGDALGALPWLVEALAVDPPNPTRERIHRLRLGTVLRTCPRLLQVLPHQGEVHHVEFSPDGRLLLTSCYDRAARLWRVASGQLAAPPLAHDGQINFAFFSPDGLRVLTASDDGTARVWDTDTGTAVTPPLRHQGRVYHAAFSPDGYRIATASADATARLWDAATGRPAAPPLPHQGAVRRVAFSPDGRLLLTSSEDGHVRFWDAVTGTASGPSLPHEHPVLHACFSPNGARAATVAADGTVRIWDAASRRLATDPLRHPQFVAHASFSPDGQRLATTCADGAARVWETDTGRLLLPLLQHGSECLHVRFSPDGRRLLTAGNDQAARVWDAATGNPLTPPLRHSGWVRQSAFSADGTMVASASGDFTARIWALPTTRSEPHRLEHPGPVTRAAFSHNGLTILSAVQETDGRGSVWLRETATGRLLLPPLRHPGTVHGLDLSPDDRRAVTACSDGKARIWDVQTGRQLGPDLEHQLPVHQADFSPDGLRLLTVSRARGHPSQVRVWRADTHEPLPHPIDSPNPVWRAAFSPDGHRLITAAGKPYGEGDEGEARVWDAATGRPLGPALRHGRQVRDAVFSPNGRQALTASSDQSVCLWDATTGTRLAGPIAHGGWVAGVRFDREGRRFLSICDDQTARVWDSATGEALTAPMKHAHILYRGLFSPDGALIATSSADGTARVWDADTGQPVTPGLHHQEDVGDVAFSPDGQIVLTASADGRAALWDLSVSNLPLPDLRLLAELLSARRLDPAGGSAPLPPAFLANALRDLRSRHPEVFPTRDSPSAL